jgi:hypothetical protein
MQKKRQQQKGQRVAHYPASAANTGWFGPGCIACALSVPNRPVPGSTGFVNCGSMASAEAQHGNNGAVTGTGPIATLLLQAAEAIRPPLR